MTSPMASVKAKDKIEESEAAILRGFDIIIDCSSSPSVLAALDNLEGNQPLFVCSFGYAAEKPAPTIAIRDSDNASHKLPRENI